ncbi:MAG: DUF420 domain-containing protein [Calditrichaeota bacterium]|nr:MAG: DUF420 domain-containing protein [Calditrichota bacterium]
MLSLSRKRFYLWNAAITTSVMLLLMWILYLRPTGGSTAVNIEMFPAVNASLNGISAVLVLIAFWAIKNRREFLHKNLMLAALIVTTLFLISYVTYHSIHGDTKFLGQGWIRPVYFFILISHVLLSMVAFPMVLSTVYFGLSDRRPSHRRIAKITLPIWLYVSVTGVLIFFFLKHYS